MTLPIPVPDDELLRSAPDLFSRHYRVFLGLEQLRAPGQRYRILDVGGRAGLTDRFFPEDEVTVVDVLDDQSGVVVVKPGAPLPFADDAFDFVVSFDVLEHVPAAQRADWIHEVVRVSRRATLFTLPDANPAALAAERKADALFRRIAGEPHPWLVEHEQFGVPTREEIRDALDTTGVEWTRLSSNPVHTWYTALVTGFVRDYARDILERPKSVIDVNVAFLNGDGDEPGYRSIYVCCKDAPGLAALLAAQPAAELERAGPLELALADLHEVERTLRAQRDEARGELDAVADARRELERANAELTRVNAQLQAATEELRADLAVAVEHLARIRGRWWYRAMSRVRGLVRGSAAT